MNRRNKRLRGLLVAFLAVVLLITELISLPFPTSGALDFGKDTSLSSSNATYHGEDANDMSGWPVKMLGDVNGDGFEDFIVGAPWNDEVVSRQGKAYLFFGKGSGWSAGKSLADADASIRGDSGSDRCGMNIEGLGDVNNDGLNDFMVMCSNSGVAKDYLFFGKSSGWSKNMDISAANVSIGGTQLGGIAGNIDVNGDGIDDFIIGSSTHGTANQAAGFVNVFFGRPSGWKSTMNTFDANASYKGTVAGDWVGGGLWGVGDVNGDGLDDFLVSGYMSVNNSVRIYLVLGMKDGWTYNISLASAKATFLGVQGADMFGSSCARVGDVNGDHLDDFMINAPEASDVESGNGIVYVFFGRRTGWAQNMDPTKANATFRGEVNFDSAGLAIAGAGDVNGDGFNDLLIGAGANSQTGYVAGKTYLVLGKSAGWKHSTPLAQSEASFTGENGNDGSGQYVDGWGDVNNDGHDDILIASLNNVDGGNAAGKTYLIFPQIGYRPSIIQSVSAYKDAARTVLASWANLTDTVHLELDATDAGPKTLDVTQVLVRSQWSDPEGIIIDLKQSVLTGSAFVGELGMSDHSSQRHGTIKARHLENVTVSSVTDPTKSYTFQVMDLQLYPSADQSSVQEDGPYQSHYWVNDEHGVIWDFKTNASWLSWDGLGHNLSGTPGNDDVGSFWVNVSATIPGKNWKEHNFTVDVVNTPPVILTTNVVLTNEGSQYLVSYNSSEGASKRVSWSMVAQNWENLSINSTTGVLSGIPDDPQVGHQLISVRVDDGNGANATTQFDLTVVNVNDRPLITTTDVTSALEDSVYKVVYNYTDQDKADAHQWSLVTKADWLRMDDSTRVLSGTPDDDDVGKTLVNVSVCDGAKSCDTHQFELTVVNVNEPPVWETVPSNITMSWADKYVFVAAATDVDIGTVLRYGLYSYPPSNASIDPLSGRIWWDPEAPGNFSFVLNVTDANITIEHRFHIVVLKVVPKLALVSPSDGAVLNSTVVPLKVRLIDPLLMEGDIVNVSFYLSKEAAKVVNKDESARLEGALVLWSDKPEGVFQVPSQLEKGSTYYWTALPNLGNMSGTADKVRSFKINMTAVVDPEDHAPVISQAIPKNTKVGQRFSYTVLANDIDQGDNAILNFSVRSGPAGLVISPKGQISWVPGKDQVGTHNVTVAVSDGKLVSEMTFKITVAPAPKEHGQVTSWVPILAVLVVVPVALIVSFVVIRRRKGQRT